MPEAIWKIPYNRPDSSALKQAGVSPLLAELLAARGVTEPAEAESLLKINRTSLLDPLKMRGMAAARAWPPKPSSQPEQAESAS